MNLALNEGIEIDCIVFIKSFAEHELTKLANVLYFRLYVSLSVLLAGVVLNNALKSSCFVEVDWNHIYICWLTKQWFSRIIEVVINLRINFFLGREDVKSGFHRSSCFDFLYLFEGNVFIEFCKVPFEVWIAKSMV